MNPNEMKAELKKYKRKIEEYLKEYIQDPAIPSSLRQAMEYSLLAGGKRIRPILCLVWSMMMGGTFEQILPFACGIELIHTYSLIHDDLPAMDDDDLRRGRPSNHVVFGEAMAILAGDALLTDSFYLMLGLKGEKVEENRLIMAMREICLAAGPRGMVGGQALDMLLTGKEHGTIEELQRMHLLKTGELIRASCVSGAILGGGKKKDIENAQSFGKSIGLAFQIADDLLDILGNEVDMGKPVGSDEKQGKLTYPLLLGLEKSKSLGWQMVDKAKGALGDYRNNYREFLEAIAMYIMSRTS